MKTLLKVVPPCRRYLLLAAALITVSMADRAAADVITAWNFDMAPYPGAGGVSINPIASNVGPVAGNGTALGMTNSISGSNYTYSTLSGSTTVAVNTAQYPYNSSGTVTSATTFTDLLSTPGVPSGISQSAWRVRGQPPGAGANGWSLAAPQFTQGAAFSANTTGYTNIHFNYDWFSTNQGVRDLQARVSTDGGSTWTSVGVLNTNIANDWKVNQSVDLSAIAGTDNNPNLLVELVSAYDPTFSNAQYAAGTIYTNSNTGVIGVYNNNSGNWRFDNLAFTGVAVPEPSSMILCGLVGGLGIVRRWRSKRKV
jgi:hypothetical protein